MDMTTWIAAGYLLTIPADYSLSTSTIRNDSVDGVVPVIATSCVWENGKDKFVAFDWWTPMPPRAGGQMEVAHEEKGTWAGEPDSVVETTMFQGTESRVVATFHRLERLKVSARLFAKGMEFKEFLSIVESSTRSEVADVDVHRFGCKLKN